jgi:hypothetical protein
VPEPAESDGDGPLIVRLAGLKPAESLQQIKGRTVNLDRVNSRAALLPCPPRLGICYSPLPQGGSFLSHRSSRSSLVSKLR